MSSTNYCQKLWNQFAKVDKTNRLSSSLLAELTSTGGISNQQLAESLQNLEDELGRMRETWDECFTTLPDGRLLFGPDYEFLNSIGLDWKEVCGKSNDYRARIDSGHRIVWLVLDERTGANISSLKGISSLSALKAIHLGRPGEISDCDEIVDLKNLETLGVHKADLEHPERIAELKSLQNIILDGFGSEDLGFLKYLSNLSHLTVRGFSPIQISDLNFLDDCQALEDVDFESISFASNDFTKIGNIPRLKNLSVLHCKNHPLDLNYLSHHQSLESIHMEYDWASMQQNDRLETIDISALITIPNLNYLSMGGFVLSPMEVRDKLMDSGVKIVN